MSLNYYATIVEKAKEKVDDLEQQIKEYDMETLEPMTQRYFLES